MDARLWSAFWTRVETQKRPSNSNLAKAIVAYMRRLDITVHAGQVRNVPYVAFLGDKDSFIAVIRGDDWGKIIPFLQSDELSPPPLPLLNWGEGVVSLSNIDVYDKQYYQRVLGVLNGLFPEDFPTSQL